MWIVADGSSVALRGHDDDVHHARFSFDERAVVTASFDGSSRVWLVDQPGSRVLVEGERIEGMRLEGDRALVKTSDEVAWWNLASGHRVPLFSWAARGLGPVRSSRAGEHLFGPEADGSAELHHRGRPPTILRGHHGAITAAEFARDGRYLFTSSVDGTLRRWDVATGLGTILFEGKVALRYPAVAEDGRVAFVHGDEMSLIAPDGSRRVLGSGPKWTAWPVFERVKDRLLLRRYDDQSFALVDGDRTIELPTDHHPAWAVASSPDGTRIAAAVGDRSVRVWDAATGRVLDVLRGHSDLVKEVAFSPDGRLLASASYDRTVRVWQPGTSLSRVLRGHTASVDQLAWHSADRIVTGSRDGTLRIWDVPALQPPRAAQLEERLAGATTAKIDVDRPTSGPPRPRPI